MLAELITQVKYLGLFYMSEAFLMCLIQWDGTELNAVSALLVVVVDKTYAILSPATG